jgi:hypothetical protein
MYPIAEIYWFVHRGKASFLIGRFSWVRIYPIGEEELIVRKEICKRSGVQRFQVQGLKHPMDFRVRRQLWV